MSKSFTPFSKRHIKAIHRLSQHYNRLRHKKHPRVLLDLIKEHAQEIAQLYGKKDKHYVTETGDLLILCLELVKEAQADPDRLMEKCYERYYTKLKQLIEKRKAR